MAFPNCSHRRTVKLKNELGDANLLKMFRFKNRLAVFFTGATIDDFGASIDAVMPVLDWLVDCSDRSFKIMQKSIKSEVGSVYINGIANSPGFFRLPKFLHHR